MDKLEIREKLIKEIKQVDNVHLLRALYDILIDEEEKKVYHLNEDQISAIQEAREQYKKGEILRNEEVDRETEEWLKE